MFQRTIAYQKSPGRSITCTYTSTATSVIDHISITRSPTHGGGNRTIYIKFKQNEEEAFKAWVNYLKAANTISIDLKEDLRIRNTQLLGLSHYASKETHEELLKELCQYIRAESGQNLEESILKDVTLPIFEEEIAQEIVEIANNNIDAAKDKVAHYITNLDTYSAAFTLAKYFHAKEQYEEAITYYQLIPVNIESHLFKSAATAIRDILNKKLCDHQEGKAILPQNKYQEYRETLLKLSLQINDKIYSTIMFYDLAGHPDGAIGKEIATTPETLIAIAADMNKLNSKVKELEAKLARNTLSEQMLFKSIPESNASKKY